MWYFLCDRGISVNLFPFQIFLVLLCIQHPAFFIFFAGSARAGIVSAWFVFIGGRSDYLDFVFSLARMRVFAEVQYRV